MTRATAFSLVGMFVSTVLLNGVCCAAEPAVADKKPVDKAAAETTKTDAQALLEKTFAESMSGVTLTGHYTLGEIRGDKMPPAEKYNISKVTKLDGDFWQFDVNIAYADHDLTVPLKLEIKWAGDTPVVTLTKYTIPLLGTFTARVLFYDNQYAGTWSGGDHGGQLFGKIAKTAAEPAKKVAK